MTSVGRSARALTVFMVRGVFGSFFRFSLSARKRRLCVVGAYSGIAAVPKAKVSREETVAPSRRSAFSASLMGVSTAGVKVAPVDDVGRSPVKVVSHCARVKPPNTSGRLIA